MFLTLLSSPLSPSRRAIALLLLREALHKEGPGIELYFTMLLYINSPFTQDITHYTVYTLHFTIHTTYYTLHTTHYTLHTTHYTLHTTHLTLQTTEYPLALSACLAPP